MHIRTHMEIVLSEEELLAIIANHFAIDNHQSAMKIESTHSGHIERIRVNITETKEEPPFCMVKENDKDT